MKICETCGDEISGKDGENKCQECENSNKKKKDAAKRRRERDDEMRGLGLVKVRGPMGGTYWE